jgi:hypothetical protein
MFFVGSNVMDWPLETQRAIADGEKKTLSLFAQMLKYDTQGMKFAFVSPIRSSRIFHQVNYHR